MPRATVKKVVIAERRRMALQLRTQGGTFDQIAERLREVEGISPKYSSELARLDVRAELANVRATNAALAEDLLHLELERFDALTAVLWPKAVKGDQFAVDRLLSISDRRMRLLGLIAPTPIMINAQGGNVAIGGTQQNLTLQQQQEMQQIAGMSPDDLTEYITSLAASNAAIAGLLAPETAAAAASAAAQSDANGDSEPAPYA